MTVLWTTEELPGRAFDPEPDDEDGPWCHTPTPTDLRQHEIRDCRGQHAGPIALRTATTIDPGRYL